MKQQIHLVTLGVSDLAVSRAFYSKLGFKEAASCSNEHIAFYDMNGVVFALFPVDRLKEDIGIPSAVPAAGGSSYSQNVDSRADVDILLKDAVDAGASLLSAGMEKPWGYSGYFADPDGHVWEVAYVPSLVIGADGRLRI